MRRCPCGGAASPASICNAWCYTATMIVVRRIVWDDWNIEHIARHNVRPLSVGQVCAGDPLVLQTYQGRLLLIGATTTRRMLAVVLAPESADTYGCAARSCMRRRPWHSVGAKLVFAHGGRGPRGCSGHGRPLGAMAASIPPHGHVASRAAHAAGDDEHRPYAMHALRKRQRLFRDFRDQAAQGGSTDDA